MKINTKNQKSVAEAYAAYDAKAQKQDNALMEAWGPMIERTTGVKDANKLSWMSQLAHNTAKAINEDASQLPMNSYSNMGGTYMPYNNLYNTLGVGNVVAPTKAGMTGADFATDAFNGSGDKFPALLPLAMKVAAKTIGFELVNTTPLAGPSGVLPYMDYVYSGSKQPWGATPAWNQETANPRYFNQNVDPESGKSRTEAAHLYGLPHAFKVSIVPYGSQTRPEAKQTILDICGDKKSFDMTSDLRVEFIGFSRIDGDPMFHVISGSGKSLAEIFETSDVKIGDITLKNPELISMLEDSIQGFTGSGEMDDNPWYGTYQDGKVIYDPMSRATGELTPARQISLQLFTRNVAVGTIEVACAVTQEQVTDLQKQWGIDVVKMVENAGIAELSQTINRHITSRLFGLGWKNHGRMVEVEGPDANLNMRFTGKEDDDVKITFAIPVGKQEDDGSYASYEQLPMDVNLYSTVGEAKFENRDTLIKRIMTNILAASNWIQQRGRYGAATFVVTNIRVASLLQSAAHQVFSPMENTLSQSAGQLYPIGTICGLTVYVDPMMAAYDCRVLVGRKGTKDEPGTHFCPYVMAEVTRIIAEGTMAPKLMVKSRYALIDAGFFPETQYVTFFVDCKGL